MNLLGLNCVSKRQNRTKTPHFLEKIIKNDHFQGFWGKMGILDFKNVFFEK